MKLLLRILRWMDNFGRGWIFEPHKGWPPMPPTVAYYRTTTFGNLRPVYKRVPAKVSEARFRAFQAKIDAELEAREKDAMTGGVPF